MSRYTELKSEIEKITEEHFFYPASSVFLNEEEKPIEWEFRKLSPSEIDMIQEKYADNLEANQEMLVLSCVYPDLKDKELQQQYSCSNARYLLYKLIPVTKDYMKTVNFVKNKIAETCGLQMFVDKIKDGIAKHGDPSLAYRYFCVSDLHMKASAFDDMSDIDKIFVMAVCQDKSESIAKMKREMKGGG